MLETYRQTRSLERTAEILGRNYKAVRRVIAAVPGLLRNQGADAKYRVRHAAFDEPMSESAAYWLGFIAADGSVVTSHGYGQPIIQVGLADVDIDHVRKLRDFLAPEKPIYETSRGGFGLNLFSVSSRQIADRLAAYGVAPHKTYAMDLKPPTAHEATFWRGFFDGDGGIYFYQDRPAIVAHLIALPNVIELFRAWCLRATGRDVAVSRPSKTAPHMFIFHADGTHLPIGILRALYTDAKIYLERKYLAWRAAERRLARILKDNGPNLHSARKDSKMPLYQHRERGFRLAEDAYLRRCAQGEFAREDFFEVVEAPPATEESKPVADPPPVAVVSAPVVMPEIEIIEEPSPTGPPIATTAEEERFFTRPAPRKRR